MLVIREFSFQDSLEIAALFHENSEHEWNVSYWVWINRILSKSFGAVALVDGKIVGHYNVIESEISSGGKLYKSGLGVHAFVHPAYRESVSIFAITKFVYELALKKGINFIYGFPNENFRLFQEKIEKWKKVALFRALTKKIDKKLPFIGGVECSLISTFYNLTQDLFVDRIDAVSYVKTPPEYFLNRYEFNPKNKYIKIKISKSDGFAIVVLKVFKATDVIRGHVVDYIKQGEFEEENILVAANNILLKEGCQEMVNWPTHFKFKQAMIKMGYEENGFETFFGIKIIDNKTDDNLLERLLNFNNWFLPMGRSDAF